LRRFLSRLTERVRSIGVSSTVRDLPRASGSLAARAWEWVDTSDLRSDLGVVPRLRRSREKLRDPGTDRVHDSSIDVFGGAVVRAGSVIASSSELELDELELSRSSGFVDIVGDNVCKKFILSTVLVKYREY
jgi:hypothetical protein